MYKDKRILKRMYIKFRKNLSKIVDLYKEKNSYFDFTHAHFDNQHILMYTYYIHTLT